MSRHGWCLPLLLVLLLPGVNAAAAGEPPSARRERESAGRRRHSVVWPSSYTTTRDKRNLFRQDSLLGRREGETSFTFYSCALLNYLVPSFYKKKFGKAVWMCLLLFFTPFCQQIEMLSATKINVFWLPAHTVLFLMDIQILKKRKTVLS